MSKTIAEKISELRKMRKMTQEQLGERLGVSGQAVSKWETGTSLPDILLLPELCEILGISAEALLEIPSNAKHKNAPVDFCAYAREAGRGAAVVDVISRLFNDTGNKIEGCNALLSKDEIRVSDDRGMGFVLTGDGYRDACLRMKNGDIIQFLQVLTDENSLSVLKRIRLDEAVTEEELAEQLGLDRDAVEGFCFH